MKTPPNALIDSNVLVYAVDRTSPKHQTARAINTEIVQGTLPAVIAHQNLLETFLAITHPAAPQPLTSSHAHTHIATLKQAAHIIHPTADTIDIWMQLVHEHTLISRIIFDAYLIATMLSHGVTTIVTDNEKDMRRFPQITVFNPFT